MLPAELSIYASLVFARYEGRYVVADIAGRGWCIPGGRLEEGETPEQAAHREAWEECGVTLGPLRPLGHYLLTEATGGKITLVRTYLAEVTEFAPLPAGTESRGVRLLSEEEIPNHYFLWDALIAAVFDYAASVGEEA